MAKKKTAAKPEKKEVTFSLNQLLSMYQQQQYLLESLTSQEKFINNLLQEVQAAQDALDEIKNSDKGTAMLVPLGSGVFTYATLSDKSAVRMDIGNNIFERMPISKAIERLEDKKANLRKNLKDLLVRKQKTMVSVAQLEKIIADAQKKMSEGRVQGVA